MNKIITNAILVIVMIGVAAASIMLFIKPNIEAKQTLDSEILQLQQRLADLQAKEADRAIYEAGIEKNKKEFEELVAKFPEDIQQENYIVFLDAMDQDKEIDDISVDNFGFEEPEEFYVMNGASVSTDSTSTDSSTTTEETTTTDTAATTTSTDSTVIGDASDAINDTNMVGLRAPITINYTGNYKGIKNMLAYIIGNDQRMTIDTMSVNYDEESNAVTGSFNFNWYAIASDQRVLLAPELTEDIDIGTKNIFDPDNDGDSEISKTLSSNLDNGDEILTDYDYYVALNASSSNADAIQIGAKGDNTTILSSNENSVQNATVKFFMVGMKYYVSYNIGDNSYPEDFDSGVEFDPGEDLNLAIQSSARKNDKDLSGIKLVIENDTDMTVNVKIDGDDASNPRVKIASRIGKVQIYE